MICVLHCLKDLLGLFSFLAILRDVFSEEPRPGRLRLILCAAVSLSLSAGEYLLLSPVTEHVYDVLDFTANLLPALAFPFVFRKPRFFRGLAVLFLYFFTADTLWSFLARFFQAALLPELLFHIAVFCAVLALLYFGARRRDLNVFAGAFREIPVWLILALLFFELTCYYREFGASAAWYDLFYAVSACMIFLSILYLAFRLFRLVYAQNEIRQKLNEQLLYETQRERSDESLRRFRHDFKNHTIVINALLEHGDTAGARRYFNEIASEAADLSPRFSTGNAVADALLNVKYAAAAKTGTAIVFEGLIPAAGIEPKDMCVCVGNLLDNAIEACAALPAEAEKTVRLTAERSNNSLLLTFTNPAPAARPRFHNGLPVTTKSDRRAHGIGLRSVRDIAKKYNGALQVKLENGVYTAELLLELRPELNEEDPTDEET